MVKSHKNRAAKLIIPPPATYFAVLLTALFTAVLFSAALHHEMWRDEIQAWLLARDSTGPVDLFHNMRYEGHPPLWHLLLMPLTRITNNPFAMQLLSLCIAAATVFLTAKYAPFNPLHKILFTFGFFPFYEYGLITRNYGLGLLLAILVCVFLPRRYQNPWPLAGALFLLAHSSVHACILAIAITCGLIADYILQRISAAKVVFNARQLVLALIIIAAGIITSALQMAPPAERNLVWNTAFEFERFESFLRTIITLLMPGVDEHIRFAGLDFRLSAEPLYPYATYICAAVCFLVFACYWRRPGALISWAFSCGGLLAFFYMQHSGSIRHHGFYLAATLMLLWSGKYWTALAVPEWRKHLPDVLRKGLKLAGAICYGLLFSAILGLHVLAAWNNVSRDLQTPFSYGKAAAQYLEEVQLDALPIIGHEDFAVSTVIGYLPKQRRAHYLRGNREGSFVIWDGARHNIAPLQNTMQKIALQSGNDVVVIFNRPLHIPPEMQNTIIPLPAFAGDSVLRDERFWLYLYRPRALQR